MTRIISAKSTIVSMDTNSTSILDIKLAVTSSDNTADCVGENIAKITSVTAFDENASEISARYSASTGIAEFANLPDTVVYFYDTGYTGTSQNVPKTMQVTVTAEFVASPDTTPTTHRSSGGGGGCNFGFGFLWLSLAALAIVKK